MTREQIAEVREALRLWADPGPARTALAIVDGLDDVSAIAMVEIARAAPALLDEREALLEALKATRAIAPDFDTDAVDAAIAKAEAP